MSDQAAETNAETGQAPKSGNATKHLVVGGAALASMAFVLGLWLVRGGSIDMLLGETPSVASQAPVAAPVSAPVAAAAPQQVLAPVATPPATDTQLPKTQSDADVVVNRPAPVAPHGVPVFVTPHGVINPLTMLHDPTYYQQWARVGVTYANPFAYQQVMNMMLQHAMQAWGMGPPVTVSVDGKRAPSG